MTDRSFITAKEARELATSSRHTVNQVYKQIREVALDNYTAWTYDVYNISEKIISEVVESLRENGYTAEYKSEDKLIYISW